MKSELHTMVLVALFASCAAASGWAQTQNSTAPGSDTAAAKASAPRIEFAEPVFDFGQITAGAVVRHAYVFTNTGTAPLAITDVIPTCGCTTIEKWPARVEAGQTGAIAIQFDSTGFNGEITHAVAVATNDPNQPQAVLTVKATVSGPIDLSPTNAIFAPVVGALASETKIIHITNRTAEPLILSAPESGNRAFAVVLKTVRPQKEFELRVTAVPPFGLGTLRGNITIKTNLSQVPTIRVPALVVVQPPVTVWPTEIRLRDAPLPSELRVRVAVRNNSAMSGFAISEATVTVPGVLVVVNELEAGRQFNVLLTFPAGFELRRGDPVELKIKTTNPRLPVIAVPIRRYPREEPTG